jgi:hypothetical protein
MQKKKEREEEKMLEGCGGTRRTESQIEHVKTKTTKDDLENESEGRKRWSRCSSSVRIRRFTCDSQLLAGNPQSLTLLQNLQQLSLPS